MINELVSAGASAGVIGFVAVVVFILCCIAALALAGLVGCIIRWIRGEKDD